MFLARASGIFLHPTSLASPFGIGDLGPEAYRFVNFLSESLQQVWQVLSLEPTQCNPYLSYSNQAGNPWLISPEVLRDKGWLDEQELANLSAFPVEQVDYERVMATKMPLFKKASENFKAKTSPVQQAEFQEFCVRQADWLDEYALFMALKDAHQGMSWHQWEPAIARRQPEAIAAWKHRLSDEIFFYQYLQFEFAHQWTNLKRYANERGIKILGDLPFYVAHDSVEVWAHPEFFCLDEETGEAALMAGVPPDYFNAEGQLWGFPIYNWEELEKDGFKWWVQRVRGGLKWVDWLRLDHFRGFQAYYAVPYGEKAIHGKWIEAPGEDLFTRLLAELEDLPIIAEDLGVITPEVEALRDRFGFPGMKVLQFAFDSGPDNSFLPFNYPSRNCVVYTGTHDNNTAVGWFEERSPEEKARVVQYLGDIRSEGIHWSLIRFALGSIANLTIFPMQDILGLGKEARMNYPGTVENWWSWRYRPETLTPELRDRLKNLTYIYGRTSN